MVDTSTEGHIDAHSLCCHLIPHGCLCSVLSPEAMCKTKICAVRTNCKDEELPLAVVALTAKSQSRMRNKEDSCDNLCYSIPKETSYTGRH